MKYCAALIALVASVMASPVEIIERQISIPGVSVTGTGIAGPTITLPSVSIPGITIPGLAIPTSFVIPGFSTVIPVPSICPAALTISIPAETINLPVAALTSLPVSLSAGGGASVTGSASNGGSSGVTSNPTPALGSSNPSQSGSGGGYSGSSDDGDCPEGDEGEDGYYHGSGSSHNRWSN